MIEAMYRYFEQKRSIHDQKRFIVLKIAHAKNLYQHSITLLSYLFDAYQTVHRYCL